MLDRVARERTERIEYTPMNGSLPNTYNGFIDSRVITRKTRVRCFLGAYNEETCVCSSCILVGFWYACLPSCYVLNADLYGNQGQFFFFFTNALLFFSLTFFFDTKKLQTVRSLTFNLHSSKTLRRLHTGLWDV